jgi:hypothetical protein
MGRLVFWDEGGFRIPRFEAYPAFTRVPACLLAEPPKAVLTSECFSGFVTSSSPIATGWSDPCRAGIAPAENRAFFTAHVLSRWIGTLTL